MSEEVKREVEEVLAKSKRLLDVSASERIAREDEARRARASLHRARVLIRRAATAR